jgi:DNA helicase-2/ATP-dependent DNA helicase PcrA
MQNFLSDLNPEQLKAATTLDGPLLILAGAGSGKTKTIISRTANLIKNKTLGNHILILTFTNKAAKEMKERGIKLITELNLNSPIPEFSTFHRWGFSFLKKYASESKQIKPNFTIADTNTQKSLITQIIKYEFGEDEKEIKAQNLIAIFGIFQNNFIDYQNKDITTKQIKNLNRKSKLVLESNNIDTPNKLKKTINSYIKYKEELKANNIVDFDDLINLPIYILEENKQIRKNIQDYYHYIMVDEFQDTNTTQIKLLNLILNKNQNICVVGDDSQSIYGWRGAKIENILTFHKQYKNTTLVNLKINYRSSKNIVSASNTLLKSSTETHEQKEKLKAFSKDKGKVLVQAFYNADEEAKQISKAINKILDKGFKPQDIVVLYRNNMIARIIEKEFIFNNIPYNILKGRSLLDKKSVQEFITFFTLFINKKNNLNLELALTSTAKYISIAKMKEIKTYCIQNNISLTKFLSDHLDKIKFNKPQLEKLNAFKENTETIRTLIKEKRDIQDIIDYFQFNFTLIPEYQKIIENSTSETSIDLATKQLNNINIISSILLKYDTVENFIEAMGLTEEVEDKKENKVSLMTAHGSKGLEFDFVFLASASDGIFPSSRSIQNNDIEEERRLFYVAITRPKKFLFVSYIQNNYSGDLKPSRFIKEAKLADFMKEKK